MSTRIAIVWNPSKIAEEDFRAAIDEALETAPDRPEITLWETTMTDPGSGAAGRALEAGADVVVAAGGDGTVRAVAEQLVAEKAPAAFGVVPLGTGNLLARNLDVPLDPADALARVLAGDELPLDVGWVEYERGGETERHAFVVMVGFGLDAHIIAETDEDLKDRAGWLAYVESMGRAVAASDMVDFRLALDGGEERSGSAHTLLVANCGTLQGGITLLPDADPGNGRLDLLLLSADDIGGWLDTMRSMVWDNGLRRLITGSENAASSESADHLSAGRVSVQLPEPRVFEIDGEEIGEVSAFRAWIEPAALRVR